MWEKRLGRAPRAVAMPALFDAARMRFDATARQRLRASLGVEDRVVLVYAGNVQCSWQKFSAVCRLTASLARAGLPVFLLALVRKLDHDIAQGFRERHGVESISRLCWSPAEQLHEYLSASDVGLFLRDDHLMNRIVTSAKLGEYLACGLPVATTGVGALYHEFIREEGVGMFLTEPDAWATELTPALERLASNAHDSDWRSRLAAKTCERFLGTQGPQHQYVRFVESLLRTRDSRPMAPRNQAESGPRGRRPLPNA
jgi:glycosyltransferase involved in cell wall biosynthesis